MLKNLTIAQAVALAVVLVFTVASGIIIVQDGGNNIPAFILLIVGNVTGFAYHALGVNSGATSASDTAATAAATTAAQMSGEGPQRGR